MGQFLSVDPKVEQTQVAYLYAADDPVNGVDPTGLVGIPGCVYTNTCPQTGGFNWHFVSALAHIGKWILAHTGILSTTLSAIAVIAFLACPETGGVTCVAGEVLSEAATGLDAVAAVHTCRRDGLKNANCRVAIAAVALDGLTATAGHAINDSWAKAITKPNLEKNAKLFATRQKQVVGAVFNAVSAIASGLSNK